MKATFDLEAKLVSEGAAELAARIKPLIKPAIYLKKVCQTQSVPQPPLFGLFNRSSKQVRIGLPVAVGASKLGGLPDFPPGQLWPGDADGPMQFLAQINCREIAAHRALTGLPADGLLQFYQSDHGNEARTLFFASGTDLRPAEVPELIASRNLLLPQFGIEFALLPTIPHSEAEDYKALKLSEEDDELLQETQACMAAELQTEQRGLHQIGGYPDAVQGDVFTEVEFYAGGKKRSWDQAAALASQWRLLLQFDTDGDLKVMWGDAGMIYFCIREDDLRAGRFENVRSTMQCG